MIVYSLLTIIHLYLGGKKSDAVSSVFRVIDFVFHYMVFALDACYHYDIWTYGWALWALFSFLNLLNKTIK